MSEKNAIKGTNIVNRAERTKATNSASFTRLQNKFQQNVDKVDYLCEEHVVLQFELFVTFTLLKYRSILKNTAKRKLFFLRKLFAQILQIAD